MIETTMKTKTTKSNDTDTRSVTIRIPDGLYWAAKKAAAEEHITLNEFIANLIANGTPR
jgi:predicted DNA binding CopG/RHH family protein